MLLVTGAGGFLGGNLTIETLAAGRSVVGAVHRNAALTPNLRVVNTDLTKPFAAVALLEEVEPAWVVNCAALANVDQCESDPELAALLNVDVPRSLALACAAAGVRLVHISTDAVFDGTRGNYTEDDDPAPINVYAWTKLQGERAVLDALPEALVLRTNFIGISPSGRTGLADWIAGKLEAGERFPGFADVVVSPLLANSLARLILAMMDSGLEGLYHVTARDSCSKYDLARMLADTLGFDATLVDRESAENSKLTARRPLNISLSPSRLEAALERPMPLVKDAVEGYAALRATASTISVDAATQR